MNLLVTSMDQVRELVSVTSDLAYSTLKPGLWLGQEFLVRYVGGVLLAELAASNLSPDQAELLPYVQAPIAALALLKFAGSGNVRLTDLGAMRTVTGDSKDAFEWQLERAVTELKTQAFDGIESLLDYLEKRLNKFPAYTASSAYLSETTQLIRSADVFSRYYAIGSSRLVFQTLLPSMRTAEITVRKVLGNSLTDLLASSLNATQAEQLDAARRALVYLTVARALRERLVSITDMGVQVNGISNFATVRYSNAPSDKQLATSISYFDKEAGNFLSDLAALIPPTPSTTPATYGGGVSGSAIVRF